MAVSSSSLAASAALSVRLVRIPEIADSGWLLLTHGVTVLTGRNNVGKTRLLQAIAALHPDAPPVMHPLPRARLVSGETTIELETGSRAVLARYEVTEPTGTEVAQWSPDRHNRGMSTLSIGEQGVVTIRDSELDQTRWDAYPVRFMDLLGDSLRRLTFVPAQRAIPGTGPARRVEVPGPNGQDLGMAIFTQRNADPPAFHELQRVMTELFPEVDAILTPPIRAAEQVQIMYRDRFAGRNTLLSQSGTGVAQALHLIALVLFSEPGRILLIDEPHAFLHPGAERSLVRFLRDHPEHAYVCATHSPVFINAADPEACWLVTRDEGGTALHPVFAQGSGRRRVFAELGIEPGEVALAERILFVEGPSDQAAYALLLARLGFNVDQRNCLVLSLAGADLTRPLSAVLGELSVQLRVPFTVLLDGDKRDEYSGNPRVCFLPAADLEDFLLQDPEAVRLGILTALAQEDPDGAKSAEAEWTQDAVAAYLADHRHPETKGPQLLAGVARKMGATYRKVIHAPLIAEHLGSGFVEQLRPVLIPRLEAGSEALDH